MGAVLEDRGVVALHIIGEAEVKMMRANDVYLVTAEEMKKNPMLMYQIEK